MAFENQEKSAAIEQNDKAGTSDASQLSCSVWDDMPNARPSRCQPAAGKVEEPGTGKVVDPAELPASVWDDLPGLRPAKVLDPKELPDSIWDDLPDLRPSNRPAGDSRTK